MSADTPLQPSKGSNPVNFDFECEDFRDEKTVFGWAAQFVLLC